MERKPIIASLDWTDFYKETMQLFGWARRPNIDGRFALTNRSHGEYPLGKLVDVKRLRWELDAVRELTFTDAEIEHRKSWAHLHPLFASPEYASFLRGFRLPPYILQVSNDGLLAIETEGPKVLASRWETPIMTILATLVGETLAVQKHGGSLQSALDKCRKEGDERFDAKVPVLKRYAPHLKFVEFGTRRSWRPDWHRHILQRAKTEFPNQLISTSNIALAREEELEAKGTVAHEETMCETALATVTGDAARIRMAQMEFYDAWDTFWDGKLSVMLGDTFTTAAFLRYMGEARARRWKGFREDSGDPIVQGDMIIAVLLGWGIDPLTKTLFLADGQTPEMMVKCFEHFFKRINVAFGPGTNFTNDVGLPTLSIVVKLVATKLREWPDWVYTVKLSNNLAKAQGRPEDVAWMKDVFKCNVTFNEKCRY